MTCALTTVFPPVADFAWIPPFDGIPSKVLPVDLIGPAEAWVVLGVLVVACAVLLVFSRPGDVLHAWRRLVGREPQLQHA